MTTHYGESAWNPVSTKRVIVGPVKATYHFAPDGGVEVEIEPF